MSSSSSRVLRVVITGGPCAGKTTFLKQLGDVFRKNNWRFYSVPETSTLLQSNGCKFPGNSDLDTLFEYETHLIKLVLQLQASFVGIAELCDR
jgi:uridine kinase